MNKLINILLDKQRVLSESSPLAQKKELISNIKTLKPDEFLLNLSSNQQNYIIELMNEELSSKEISIIKGLSILKNKNIISFNETQLQIIETIVNKIKNKYNSLNDHIVEKEAIATLLESLRSNKEIIGKNEYLEKILSENFSVEEQISIYKELNSRNFRVLNHKDIKEELELSEKDLTITNISMDEVSELFNRYNINWSSNDSSLEESQNRNEYTKQYLLLLAKYGNLEQMEIILSFLKEKELDFVFNLPEILTNTLLFSSKEKIEQFIEVVTNEFGMDYKELIKAKKQNLYPAVREIRKVKGKKAVTGSLNKTLNAMRWLKNNGISVQEAYSESASILDIKVTTMQKVLDRLQLYGIKILDESGKNKNGLHVLDTLNVMDKLDAAIESSIYEYFQDHINALRVNDKIMNIYAIKLALLSEQQSSAKESVFYKYSSDGKIKTGLRQSYIRKNFGATLEETFKMYGATSFSSNNKYEELLKENELDVISDEILNDNIILKLDELYKVDELRYNFNGTIISRKKVLRVFTALKNNNLLDDLKNALMYAITRNSMLNEEELNNISICIENVLGDPVRRY